MSFQAEGYDLLFYFFIFTFSDIQGQLYRLQVVCRSQSFHEKTLEQIRETTLLALKTTAAPIPIESICMHERTTLRQETLLIVLGNEQFLLNCVNYYSLVMCDTTYITHLPNSPFYSYRWKRGWS